MQLRRQDRALTSLEDIVAVLDRCLVVRLGLVDDDGPYVVPVNFGYKVRDGRVTVYAHGAPEGRKVAAVRGRPGCCVEADILDGLHDGGAGACGLSAYYRSVIGFGTARIVDAPSEAHEALALIVARQRPDLADDVPTAPSEHVAVIAVDLDTVSGKCHALDTGKTVE